VAIKLIKARRGRPQKFGRPSHAVTLTLPDDVIAGLSAVDNDLSRAVVRLSQPLLIDVVVRPPAELSKYGHSAVIVIKPLPALDRMPGVSLVPLPDGRALISLDEAMSVHEFELKLSDAIDVGTDLEAWERSAMSSIREILKSARQSKAITVHQRSIIVLQSTRHRRIP
jgi:hypothetical protein